MGLLAGEVEEGRERIGELVSNLDAVSESVRGLAEETEEQAQNVGSASEAVQKMAEGVRVVRVDAQRVLDSSRDRVDRLEQLRGRNRSLAVRGRGAKSTTENGWLSPQAPANHAFGAYSEAVTLGLLF